MVIRRGTPYGDTFYGTNVADTLYGFGGIDTLHGRGGNDTLFGGDGKDWLYGEAGNDTVYGQAGRDRIFGGAGNDTLRGGSGDDDLDGGDGADRIWGGDGFDFLSGYGNDRLYGDAGTDSIVLYSYGKAWGGTGADTLYLAYEGGSLYGEAGNDRFGVATDAVWATLSGGDGADSFDIRSFDDHDQDVTVTDFKAGEDHLDLTQLYRDDANTWVATDQFIAMMDVDSDGRLTATDAHVAANGFSVVAGTNGAGQGTLTLHMDTVTVFLDNCDTFF